MPTHENKHVLFFIHGIGDGHPVMGSKGGSDYADLWELIDKHYRALHKAKLEEFFLLAPVDWDIATERGERYIFESMFSDVRPGDRTLVGPGHPIDLLALMNDGVRERSLRYFTTFFVGDVIAYVDSANNGIRQEAWVDMASQFGDLATGRIRPYSIIGHSLGSIIAYDFIFWLTRSKLFEGASSPQPSAQTLQAMAAQLTNLYTLGSPIAYFMMRKKELWENRFENLDNPVENDLVTGKNRVWLNFWNKQDLVSYPLEKIFHKNPATLKDFHVDTLSWFDSMKPGVRLVLAHTNYWRVERVAREIAKTLPPPAAFL